MEQKKIFLTLAFTFIIFINGICQISYFWQNPLPTGNVFKDVKYFDNNNVIAVGSAGTVLLSNNGGNTWTTVSINSIEDLNKIEITDSNTAFVVANNMKIFKTTNKGLNWNLSYSSYSDEGFIGISFINANTGFAILNNSGIYYKTTNSGQSWTQGTQVHSGGINYGIYFQNANTGYVLGQNTYKTTNSGASWFYAPIPSNPQFWSTDIAFINSTTGIIVGLNFFYKTVDGGLSWDSVKSGQSLMATKIKYLNENKIYVTGILNDYISTDGGTTWQTIQTGVNKFSIDFRNSNIGIGAGNNFLATTINGGNEWQQKINGVLENLSHIQFLDQNTGYVVGDKGTILKTINGGNDWIPQQTGTQQNFWDAYFLNANTGFAVGDSGWIVKTTNGGNLWTKELAQIQNKFLVCITFYNSMTGYIGGFGGNLRTTNGGLNWNVIEPTNPTFTKVTYADSNTLFAGQIMGVQKSTDGGLNWNFMPLTQNSYELITDVSFKNQFTGYAVSDSGWIYSTTNGGLNWSTGFSYGQHQPYCVVKYFDQNSLYIGGREGKLLVKRNDGAFMQLPRMTDKTLKSICFAGNYGMYLAGTGGTIIKSNVDSNNYISISGYIKYNDNQQPVTSGIVKAMFLNKSTGLIEILDSTYIQPNGFYSLPNVRIDSVYIGAYPSSGGTVDYVPTLYPSSINWQLASRIYSNSNLTNINVTVQRLNLSSEKNTGNVYGGVYSQTIINPLKDAIIYAKLGNSFKSFSISGSNGLYNLINLPTGNYKLYASRIGYNFDSLSVNVTSSNLNDINFYLNKVYVGINNYINIVPASYNLYQNFPNPFNPVTIIKFTIPKNSFVTLKIYDILGREVASLVNNTLDPGKYSYEWNASSFSSGIYFCRLSAGDYTNTIRMVLMK